MYFQVPCLLPASSLSMEMLSLQTAHSFHHFVVTWSRPLPNKGDHLLQQLFAHQLIHTYRRSVFACHYEVGARWGFWTTTIHDKCGTAFNVWLLICEPQRAVCPQGDKRSCHCQLRVQIIFIGFTTCLKILSNQKQTADAWQSTDS